MTHSNAAHSAFAQRYASAYIDSISEKEFNNASQEIEIFLSLIEESKDLSEIIVNPLFSKESKSAVFEELGKKAKASKTLITFIQTIIENNRLSDLRAILQAVLIRLDAIQGIVEAKIETAYPLNKTQSADLEKQIGKITGGKARISVEVKPELIGGIVITIGSKRIDGSIKRRLELLEQDLRDGANENFKQAKTA